MNSPRPVMKCVVLSAIESYPEAVSGDQEQGQLTCIALWWFQRYHLRRALTKSTQEKSSTPDAVISLYTSSAVHFHPFLT